MWRDRERAYLVDTVLKSLPIPEIYVHVQTTAAGATTYSVVDGQQRVRALLDFVAEKFPLLAEFTPELGEHRFSELPEEARQRFWAYSLVVRELHEASDADVRDLFERLNRFVYALNPQELRNARYKGEFISVVTGLADDDFWVTNRIVTPNDIRRMLDVQFVSELLVGLIAGPQHKTETLDDFYEMYEASFADKAAWVRAFNNALELLMEFVPELPTSHWRKKSSFYSLFLVAGEIVHRKMARKIDLDKARETLGKFGELSETALSKDPPENLPPEVRAYAIAVGRAASDRDRRIERHSIIEYLVGLRPNWQ